MRLALRFCIVTFVLSIGASPAHANAITVLNQTYTIGIVFEDIESAFESSSTPFDLAIRGISASTGGTIGLLSGGLSASVDSGGGAGGASARLDFEIDFYGSIDMNAHLGNAGLSSSGIRFTNLTDGLLLLDMSRDYNADPRPSAGSFLFLLDPQKDYRLESWAFVPGPDGSGSSVNFRVTVPDSAYSMALLLLAIGSLAAGAHRTFTAAARQ